MSHLAVRAPCKRCGDPTRPRSPFCSRRCHRIATVMIGANGKALPPPKIPCAECKAVFQPKRTDSRFCGLTCKNRSSNRTLPPPKIPCAECKAVFQPKRTDGRFCGLTCKNGSSNRTAARKDRSTKLVQVLTFDPEFGGPGPDPFAGLGRVGYTEEKPRQNAKPGPQGCPTCRSYGGYHSNFCTMKEAK